MGVGVGVGVRMGTRVEVGIVVQNCTSAGCMGNEGKYGIRLYSGRRTESKLTLSSNSGDTRGHTCAMIGRTAVYLCISAVSLR